MSNAFHVDDTIAALATAREPGYPRGIVRVSGPNTLVILDQFFRSNSTKQLASVRNAQVLAGCLTCQGLATDVPVNVLIWPAGRSYTNQIATEIHTIGSLPILESILDQLCQTGARLAEPGEFTLRAFLSGRLDLTAAEAVLGVIDASDQKQLKTALEQLAGGLEIPLQEIRTELIESLAHLEAGLDFVEEDIEFISSQELRKMLSRGFETIERLEKKIGSRGDVGNHRFVVLYGAPNVGKSSLFNALIDDRDDARKETPFSAIVSSIAGTTRDYVTGKLRIDGVEFTLVDTAGIDEADWTKSQSSPATSQSLEPVDAISQSTSDLMKDRACLELFCIDSTRSLSEWEKKYLNSQSETRLVCLAKCDQPKPEGSGASLENLNGDYVCTSATTGQGIDSLRHEIASVFSATENFEAVGGTTVRCTALLRNAKLALQRAVDFVDRDLGEEFVASEVRIALEEIGKMTGAIYTDDILDVVFGKFCVGK